MNLITGWLRDLGVGSGLGFVRIMEEWMETGDF